MQQIMEMQTSWDYRLVALSVVIAIIGSYIALDFAGRMKSSERGNRKLWFASGALMMGLAIWSMHFVGMLALIMPMPVTYDEALMFLSILAAATGSGIAFAIMNRPTLSRANMVIGSIAMGIAISAMHYTGMASMKMTAAIHYNPVLFVLSVVIAIIASAAALWIAFWMRRDNPEAWFWQKTGSAVVMGFAISGMHYTGMIAAHYYHTGGPVSELTMIPTIGSFKLSDLLIAAAVIFGFALLLLSSQTAGEKQKALQSARKSLEREKLVADIIDSIRSETDLGTILRQTVDSVGHFTQADRCEIWLYNAVTGEFDVPRYEYRSKEQVVLTDKTAFPNKPVLSSILAHTDIINLPDILQAEDLTDEDYRMIRERGIKSLLQVPILYKDELLGILRIHSVFKKRAWDEETVFLINHMAAHAAIAVYYAKTLQELRDSEQTLKESEERFRTMADSSPVMIWTFNPDWTVSYYNKANLEFLGYPSLEEAFHQDWTLHIHPEDLPFVRETLSKAANAPESFKTEYRAKRADGEYRWILSIGVPRTSSGKSPIGYVGSTIDITEQKEVRQELERLVAERTEQLKTANKTLQGNEERTRLLIETVKDYAICRLDPNGIIQTWNKGAEKIKGYTAPEIIGRHFSIFYPEESLQQAYPDYELKIAMEQGGFENEGWRIKKDGSTFWANVVITALRDETGELIGFSEITRDLTERKQAEEELRASEQRYRQLAETLQRQTTQLEAVNQELETFSYSISHDLRAPLRAIDGFSQAILEMYEDKLDEKGLDYLNRVRQGSQLMAQLIDDMLQLSRLSRGQFNPEDNLNLSAMVQEIADALHWQEPQRQVAFDIEEGIVVRGDRRLLQVALKNLIGNAWKYTSKHPTAHIHFGKIQSNGTSIYYVQDDGIGFNMKYADKLFGAFQRLHGPEEFPGTGVGLATVARIVHRHAGKIWAEAEVEKGATFYFTLQPIHHKEKQHVESTKANYSAG